MKVGEIAALESSDPMRGLSMRRLRRRVSYSALFFGICSAGFLAAIRLIPIHYVDYVGLLVFLLWWLAVLFASAGRNRQIEFNADLMRRRSQDAAQSVLSPLRAG